MTIEPNRIAYLLALILLVGCRGPNDDAALADRENQREREESGPAVVRGVVRLEAGAQQAIGLETCRATRRSMPQQLETTGWLVARPGHTSVVKAAATGYYLPVSENSQLEVGDVVSRGQELGSLKVFLSPQEEAQLVAAKEEADMLMKQALVSQQLAEEQLKNLESNKARAAVAGTRLLELQEIAQRNRVAYQEAREKLPFLPAEPYAEDLAMKSVAVDAPLDGRIAELHAAPRQLVVQGDPLWTIADWSVLWVRVPVFEGDLPRVASRQPALVNVPGDHAPRSAKPVPAPQPTEAGRRTVDVYYQLENVDNALRPGQPVTVALSVGQTVERAVLPRRAVVWDGLGGSWVYVKTGPATFRRQRVELAGGDAESVAVERGVNAEDEVVSVGVESLYGEEFKGQLQAEDDD